MNEHYDIFISYRRDGGFETAKHLNDLLVHDGYTVSFDIDTLREGDFDETLLKRIDQCVDFILVVDKHTFDRTLDPDFDPKKDWLRTELAYALKLRKNIIPVLLSGVNGFPTNLPEDIADVDTKNGPEYSLPWSSMLNLLGLCFTVEKSTKQAYSPMIDCRGMKNSWCKTIFKPNNSKSGRKNK